MKNLKIHDLDYRQILIQSYKSLGLTELELIVLLLIESLNKEQSSLIIGEQLSYKMNLSASVIDNIIVSLMDKAFLSYEQENGQLVTSCKKMFERIMSYIEKQIMNKTDIVNDQEFQDNFRVTLQLLEKELKRSLLPLEIQMITSWYDDNVEQEVISSAINECIMKKGKISVKQIDRYITTNLRHKDRVSEGFTTVDEKTKRDIKKAIDIASYDWVNNDD